MRLPGDRTTTTVVVVVSALLLGPALRPGYALVGDQVFVPDQSLLPWMVGLGGGLPRSVPQDAVVALLTGPVPGWVWQTVALVAALVLLGTGVARLLRGVGPGTRTVAAVLAVWSPYVGERLLLGHWSLLLALAALPWALRAADDARVRGGAATARWLLWVALASLTVTGGLLVLALSVPVLLWRGGRGPVLAAMAGLVLQLPWLVPVLVHPVPAAPGGADVFALRAEGGWGSLVTALGTGGAWNTAAVPATRGTVLGLGLTVVLLGLAWWGRRAVLPALGRPVGLTLAVASAAGLVVAVAGGWSVTAGATEWVVATVPGGGLVRDGQKWLAPWLLLLAVSAALGARRVAGALVRRTSDASVGTLLVVAFVLLPIACIPDLAWGALGRLATVDYPSDWGTVRTALADDRHPGDVVSLPWSTFRRFSWNLGRTVLDPAPRAMPRTVVASDDLVVRHGSELVVVPGDDPRAGRISAAVAAGVDLGPTLRREGIGWAVVAGGATGSGLPAGATRVAGGADLALYRLPDPDPYPPPGGAAAVLGADLVALVVVVGAVAGLVRRRPRRADTPELDVEDEDTSGATRW